MSGSSTSFPPSGRFFSIPTAFISVLCVWMLLPIQGAMALAVERQLRAGNPVFEGWYADPDAHVFGEEYWIYPTASRVFGEQTYFDAFSSKDLTHWVKHERVLDFAGIPWTTNRGAWAPGVGVKDGKYYMYYSAGEGVGIGVAEADGPAGPFVDVLGAPLVGEHHHGAQPIDAMVFQDEDGSNYLYWGGMFHCVVAALGDDMVSLKGEIIEITPPDFVEGTFMVKRGGKYYLMYSIGAWDNETYSVQYVKGDSPFGPFTADARSVLQSDPKIGTGPGHHSVFHVDGEYYIAYHRRFPGDNETNNRVVCIDRMFFNDEGEIELVKLTAEGVEPRPL